LIFVHSYKFLFSNECWKTDFTPAIYGTVAFSIRGRGWTQEFYKEQFSVTDTFIKCKTDRIVTSIDRIIFNEFSQFVESIGKHTWILKIKKSKLVIDRTFPKELFEIAKNTLNKNGYECDLNW